MKKVKVFRLEIGIWGADFIGEVTVDNILYSVALNEKEKRLYFNQVFYVDGRKVLKNPAFSLKAKDELIDKILNEPRDQQLNLLNAVRKTIIQIHSSQKQSRNKTKIQKQRGRGREPYLIEATIWAIDNHLEGEKITDTAKRAFQKFQKGNEESFKKAIQRNWKEAKNNYDLRLKKTNNSKGSFKKYAKTYLKKLLKRIERKT